MIPLIIKIYISLISFFLLVGCSYNYEKNSIDKNINPVSIIINAKSFTVKKDIVRNVNINTTYIKKINDRLLEEFESWLYEKFDIQGNENEAAINILLAEAKLLKNKNNSSSFFKKFFIYKEELYKINLEFYLVIYKEDYFNKRLQIKSSTTFSLFDNMTLSERESLVNNEIKRLIKKIDIKISQDLQGDSFKSVIQIN